MNEPATSAEKSEPRKASNKEEEKFLAQMESDDFSHYIPTDDNQLRWHDILPLPFIIAISVSIFLVSFVTKKSPVFVSFLYIPFSVICIVIAIHKAGILHRAIFETRFVSPSKLAYTRVIVSPDLIPRYRFWTRTFFSNLEFFILFFSILYFQN